MRGRTAELRWRTCPDSWLAGAQWYVSPSPAFLFLQDRTPHRKRPANPQIVTIFIALWINRYYTENDLCHNEKFNQNGTDVLITQCAESLVDEGKIFCRDGYTRSSVVGGIAQTMALIGAPIFGYLNDKLGSPVKSVVVAALFGAIGYACVAAASSPETGVMLAVAAVWGLAEISMIVAAQVLVTFSMPSEEARGTVSGVFSVFGGIGIMVCSYLGGWLFDNVLVQGPFILASSINALIALVGVYVWYTTRGRDFVRRSGSGSTNTGGVSAPEFPARKHAPSATPPETSFVVSEDPPVSEEGRLVQVDGEAHGESDESQDALEGTP